MIFFFPGSKVFNDTTIVFFYLKQVHSFIMEWVLTSQHNSMVFKCDTETRSGK